MQIAWRSNTRFVDVNVQLEWRPPPATDLRTKALATSTIECLVAVAATTDMCASGVPVPSSSCYAG